MIIREQKLPWTNKKRNLRDEFDYDIYGVMLLDQAGASLVRVEVMLDET